MVSVGKDLKYHIIPSALPWAVIPFTRADCSELHPAWPYHIRYRASTISLGNLFQCLTTLMIKTFLPSIYNLSLHSLNLEPFPLVLSLRLLIVLPYVFCKFSSGIERPQQGQSLFFSSLNNPNPLIGEVLHPSPVCISYMYEREDGELGSEELCQGRCRPPSCPLRKMSLHTVLGMGAATSPCSVSTLRGQDALYQTQARDATAGVTDA